MDAPEPKNISKNFMFAKADVDRLEECKLRTGVAGSVIIRHALAYYWTMLIAQRPMCANGSMCLAPHLFANIGTQVPQSPAATYEGVPLAPAFHPEPAPPPSVPEFHPLPHFAPQPPPAPLPVSNPSPDPVPVPSPPDPA